MARPWWNVGSAGARLVALVKTALRQSTGERSSTPPLVTGARCISVADSRPHKREVAGSSPVPATWLLSAALLALAGCGTGTDTKPVAPPTTPEPAPAPEPPPREPRICTDERERAESYANAILPGEWDGSPFRVDLVDHFPAVAGADYPAGQLEEVGRLADQIEEQIGYRILEVGSVIPLPENLPEGWNAPSTYGPRDCEQWREPGQILGIHTVRIPPGYGSGGGAFGAAPWCAVVSYWLGNGLSPDESYRIYARTGIVHEIFHLFGFKHDSDAVRPEPVGIFMSAQLTSGRIGDGAQYPTFDDVDAMRCIFPQGG